MDKSAEAFRTISEVAEDLGIPKHVLRFWEIKFAQIRPMKRGGGRRYYRPEDLDLLRGVQLLLHRDGYTIKGVQKILREQGTDIVKQIGRGEASAGTPARETQAADLPEGRAAEAEKVQKPRATGTTAAGRRRAGRRTPEPASGDDMASRPLGSHAVTLRAALATLRECHARLSGGVQSGSSRPARKAG